ncbi:MAG: hypothetical protein HC880_02390, partial [Bacteroidia bacterium]|nr:hypothetical protein [Bacteroidia bacterium]
MKILLISNPENRRTQFFKEAAAQQGYRVVAVSYLDLLTEKVNLAEELAEAVCLRIDHREKLDGTWHLT